jgi:hypothetical protein
MNTISEIVKFVLGKQASGLLGREVYFRGQRDDEPLVPSLLRNKNLLAAIDNYLYCDAIVMGRPELVHARNSWEELATFQHYGIPTRLLDWSSSLLSALYFAFNNCLRCDRATCKRTGTKCGGHPIIYLLDPSKMHRRFHGRRKISDNLAVTIGVDKFQDYMTEFVMKYPPGKDWEYKKGPVFLEIPWFNTRMQGQKGYFTFHTDETPLETALTEKDGLVKIVLPGNAIKGIAREFEALGINEHDMFRDLPSLANYLKLKYRLQ